MTSGPTYGQGFIDLEPRLSRDFLTRINNQLDRAFSNIQLDVDDTSLRAVRSQLEQVETSAGQAAQEVAKIADRAGASVDDFRALARHMDISEDEARRLADQVSQAQVETRQLDDAAQRVARSLGLSESEARQFADQMNRAGNATAGISRLDTTIGKLRSSLGNAALAAVAFFGARGVLNQATQARDAFIALGESVNAVEVVFGDASQTIFTFADTVAQSAGLARSEFQQMATVLGAALQNAGLTADEAAAKTVTLTQRAADLASVFNTDVSDALGAIQAALRGEADPIERFGVSLSAAAVDGEAAALGFSRVAGEFDNTAKAAARVSLIMEQTNRVAGDFANTSDSLANRQRIAAAEMENVRAELGEALLPVFEAIVDVGPQVVDGLKNLAPALSALAVSAGELATATPGVLDFMDAVNLFTDLPRGFGQLIDVGKTFGSLFTGTFDTLEEIARLDFSNLSDNFTGVGNAAQSAMERINTQGLIDDLREGGDAATVLGNRLAEVGRKGKLNPEFIRNLREIAGTDLTETASVLGALVEDAERLGFTADEIAILTAEWARLRNEIFPVGNEVGQAALAMADMHHSTREFPRIVSGFDEIGLAAEEVGLSLVDLVLGLDPVARAMTEGLTPTQQTALAMHAIQTEAGAAAQILDANLRPAIIDASSALVDLNKNGSISAGEFVENARKMTEAAIQLAIDLSTIAAVDPATALALATLDPAQAAQIIRDFAAFPEGIKAAAEALTGTPKQLGAAILQVYADALPVLQSGDQKAIDTFLAFTAEVTEKSLPGVTDAFGALFQPALDASFADLEPPDLTPAFVSSVEGMDAQQIAASVDDVLDASFADVEVPDITNLVIDGIERWNSATIANAVENALFANVDIDLTQEGIQARGSFFDGLSTVQPGETEDLRKSITNVVNDAIQVRSPSKLFLGFGSAAGDAFWSGFTGTAMDFPGVDLTRSFNGARAASDVTDTTSGGGPLIGSMTVNNPVGEPTEESVQSALIEVAISPIVNRLVSAGSSL